MTLDFEIKISDNPNFKGVKKVTETDFQSDPKKYLNFSRDGYQVHVVDDNGKLIMVLGSNGPVKIEVIPSEEMVALQKQIEEESADEPISRGYHTWFD